MNDAPSYLELAAAQARLLRDHLKREPKPITHIKSRHDAHVGAWEAAESCQRCGELFAKEQMLHGECIACWHEGLERDRAEEAGYAELVRRMS